VWRQLLDPALERVNDELRGEGREGKEVDEGSSRRGVGKESEESERLMVWRGVENQRQRTVWVSAFDTAQVVNIMNISLNCSAGDTQLYHHSQYLDAWWEELRELRCTSLLRHPADDLNALLDDVVAVTVVHAAKEDRRVLELAHQRDETLGGDVF
jgi:hypothetical protein